MTRNRKLALLSVAALALCSAGISTRAQTSTPPIVIKAKTTQPPETKPIKVRFEVLHMMVNAIQVRSLVNERELHTFVYSDQIRDRMQALFNNGGYQYGDKIDVFYKPGTDIALNIKGKPSKPI